MALGVDLGTTNSSVAWTDAAGAVYSLKVRRGPKEPFDAVERSLVLDPLGPSPIVGHLAEGAPRRAEDAPLVSSFKRRFDKARLRQSRYEVVTTPTSEYDPVNLCIRFAESGRRVPIYYDEYSLDEVTKAASLVLERLLTSTEIDPDGAAGRPSESRSVLSRLTGRRRRNTTVDADVTAPDAIDLEPSERLYVGVPVSFGPTARRRLLRSLVGSNCFGNGAKAYREVLDRCRLVYEPLALVSTLTLLEKRSNVFIVDYGGGTLDLAYLQVDLDGAARTAKELALGGLPTAGDHLDDLFREHLLTTRSGLRHSFEQQIAGGPEDRFQAYSAFSRAKVALSTNESSVMRLFGDLEVTRAEFETAVADELGRLESAVNDTLAHADAKPRDVGSVLLTGGSSLIPAVQDRLRAVFSHLSDDLSFDAGKPGDVESERRALTGVSRGLARFGFLESFEASAPCTFTVVVPDTPATRTVCLERGAPDVFELNASPPVRIPVRRGTRSVVVYSDLLRDTYCGAVADLDLPDGEIEVRVSAARDRFAPAFTVRRGDTGKELERFDLDGMSPTALRNWVDGDGEWMPPAVHVESMFLTRPLEVGDFVEWGHNGAFRKGKIIDIRDISSGSYVERMTGFDPEHYVMRVAIEEHGAVKLGQIAQGPWGIGDIRLA